METTSILGGNGKTGRRVAERLAALGRPHRIASRSAGARHFDWNDERTWPGALHGASAIFADVAVAALEGDGHAGRTYELTGPRRLLTFAEAAAEIAAAAAGAWR